MKICNNVFLMVVVILMCTHVFGAEYGHIHSTEDSINYYKTKGGRFVANNRALSFWKKKIQNKDLKYLKFIPGISSLTLSETQFSNDGAKYLADMNNIRSLFLEKTLVTSDGLKYFKDLVKYNIQKRNKLTIFFKSSSNKNIFKLFNYYYIETYVKIRINNL